MRQFRQTLALPGFRTLLILMFFARLPVTAAHMVMTLHVAVGMGRSYGQAGLAGAAATIGISIGAPLMGRVIDRYGLRFMLVIVTIGETAFWLSARFMPYPALVVAAFAGGVLVVPVMSIGRQAIGVLVPEDLRRAAYSMDSISVELTFMVGPAVAVFVATQVSTQAALTCMAVAVFVVGVVLWVVDTPVREAGEHIDTTPMRRSEWLTPRLIGVLAVGTGAVFVLSGTEVTVVAALRGTGQLEWTGAVIAAMCVASAAGGVVHGAVRRSLPQVWLLGLLSVLVIPVAVAGSAHWWVLALVLIPTNFMCAPTIAATGEQVSKLAPPAKRGEATGLQSSAFTLGGAIGAPLIGFAVDHGGAGWGFVVTGVGGSAVAGLALWLTVKSRRRARDRAEPEHEEVNPAR